MEKTTLNAVLVPVFALLAAAGFALGMPVVALFMLFYAIAIPCRYIDTFTDVMGVESIGAMTIILAILGSPMIAAIYAFSCTWFTRLISPFGVEEYTYTVSESIGFMAAAILSPMLMAPSGMNLIPFAFYFTVTRFAVFQVFMTITQPGLFLWNIMQTSFNFPWIFIQLFFIMSLFGMQLVSTFGADWSLGSLSMIKVF
jgi:hypothetical protein